ncbi:MAG: hypothetical protein ABSD43_04450, partial [Terracidiphilus sp.]
GANTNFRSGSSSGTGTSSVNHTMSAGSGGGKSNYSQHPTGQSGHAVPQASRGAAQATHATSGGGASKHR